MAELDGDAAAWFAVRCVLHHPQADLYEERITLWMAADFDAAIALAEAEAERYADDLDLKHTGLAQAYRLFDEPGHASEVFSLMRESNLTPDDYLTAFFQTGAERQGTNGGE